MILSDVSIKRPVFATMLNVVIIVFGLFSLPKLAIEQYPNIDFPVVSVWITWPGADPKSIADQVLEPLERAVNGISGLEKIMSTAYPNAAMIVLQFQLDTNSDKASQNVRDKVFATLGDLPKDIDTPVVQKIDIGGAPIMNLTLTAKNMNLGALSKLAQDVIRPKLQRVDGVAKVDLSGDRKREIQVLLNPSNLSSYAVSPMDVVNSIKAQNLDVPAGKIETATQIFGVRVDKKASSADDVAQLPILSMKPNLARVRDVGEVKDTIADETSAAFVNQSPTILLSVFKSSGGNTNAIADGIRETVKKMNQSSNANFKIDIVTDNSKYVKGSIDAVELDLIMGALLAVLVVFLFLRDWRATLISAVALPTAVIGTFAFLNALNFTLNMMTTLALSLSIGILVDDAIVVIENIYRHLSMGKNPIQAAKDATAEIGLAVFATTLTICAVFVPVAFMDGIIGRFFFQFGLTVTFAVLVSLFVAFTLTPMLSSRLLKAENHHSDDNKIERWLNAVDERYKKILAWCLYHRWKTLGVGVASFVFSLVLLSFIPVSFFPREDRSIFTVSFTLPENTNIQVTKAKALQVAHLLNEYPGVKTVVTSVAAGNQKKPNHALLNVNLVPVPDRNYSQSELMTRVRHDLKPLFEEDHAEFEVSEEAQNGGRPQTIQLVFMGDDREELVKVTDAAVAYLKDHVVGLVDLTTTKAKSRLEYNVDLNLNLSKDVALNTSDMALSTRALFEGQKVGQIEDKTGRYDIRVKASPQNSESPQDLSSVTFNSAKGQLLPFSSVSTLRTGLAASTIERYDGRDQITVLANYTGRDLNAVSKQIDAYVKAHVPPTISTKWEGEADIMGKSIIFMISAVLLAVLLIYMILCAQYERYLAPFVIMMALPLSFTGAFGALLLTGQFISVYTMIGLILLMGIVTKNGILLIDFTLHKMSEGKSVYDALMEAGPVRLRPILMTTFAASFGMLPVAMGHGEGGDSKAPMGVAVIGGLLVSTLLTLVVVPCLFSLMESWRSK